MAYRDVAFKSAEIEELSDVYFFRPLGWLVARAGQAIGLTPVGLTVIGTIIGVAGGALLYDEGLGLLAFGLLILHSIVDSADGQLARLTGKVTELGRVLDGLSGYATHVAIYFGIALGLVHRSGDSGYLLWMLLAGLVTPFHAGMYEYYRYVYTAVVTEARVPKPPSQEMPPLIRRLFSFYLRVQRRVIGPHTDVEAMLAARSADGHIPDEDRARYRKVFYPLVRGWNFLGDNTRFYAIGVFAFLHRLDLFFLFVLGPMNLALIILWLWQRRADRKFLGGP